MPLDEAKAVSETTTLQELARRALRFDPSWAAIEHEGQPFDWGQMQKVAREVAAALAATGVERRQPVALIPRNRPSAVAALLGLIAEGQAIQMIYAFQAPAALAQNIARLRPAVVVGAARELSDELKAVLREQSVAAIEICDMEARLLTGLERARPADPETPRDQRIELFTSGTTGPPKQRPFPYEFFAKSHVLPPMLARPDADWQAEAPPMLPYPIGNISGMMSLLPAVLRGQPVILPDRFTLDGWRAWIARTRPVFTGIPPAGVRMILDAQVPKEELSFIKFMSTGGGPVEAEDMRRLKAEYGITVLLNYGATEFGGTVVGQGPETIAKWGDKKFGSAGQAVPGAKIRVIDPETGQVLGPNQVGILEVVSPMMGPEWIRTSDLAEIDEDGFMYHRGRADGAIVRGGFKLVPEVIERALMLHPAVAVAAVVGRKDRRLGQVPATMIQLDPTYDGPKPDIGELETHLRSHLPATHVPVDWKIVEAIPRTPSFKIDRGGVRKLFEDEAEARAAE